MLHLGEAPLLRTAGTSLPRKGAFSARRTSGIASPSAAFGLISGSWKSVLPHLVPGVSGSPSRARPVGPGRLSEFRLGHSPSMALIYGTDGPLSIQKKGNTLLFLFTVSQYSRENYRSTWNSTLVIFPAPNSSCVYSHFNSHLFLRQCENIHADIAQIFGSHFG